ncbi:hypothetical protein DID80_02715 [Candidatus Marinamargulisbacteria bacterium SCGC AAA071-K20]|nr:hypothetical protein DID80_02715 [Candidatus Marinamargulisbacteria bacterium SCGC AAA071-K20]
MQAVSPLTTLVRKSEEGMRIPDANERRRAEEIKVVFAGLSDANKLALFNFFAHAGAKEARGENILATDPQYKALEQAPTVPIPDVTPRGASIDLIDVLNHFFVKLKDREQGFIELVGSGAGGAGAGGRVDAARVIFNKEGFVAFQKMIVNPHGTSAYDAILEEVTAKIIDAKARLDEAAGTSIELSELQQEILTGANLSGANLRVLNTVNVEMN